MRAVSVCFVAFVCVSVGAQKTCVEDAKDLDALKSVVDQMRTELAENPTPRGCPMQGKRGIVTSFGTQRQMDNAFVSIKHLRNTLKSTLPVTVYHWGNEIPAGVKSHFTSQFGGVNFVDMKPLETALPHRCSTDAPHGFAMKAHAMYHAHSSYEHVLWLDTDNFLLDDPELVFQTEDYKEDGNTFWPDFFNDMVNPQIYETLTGNLYDGSHGSDTESGQVVLNTCKHQDVLEYLLVLNENPQVTYSYMFGDKDTFRLAFALAAKLDSFRQVPVQPAGAFTSYESSLELQRLHMEAAARSGSVVDLNEFSRCQSGDTGLLLAMIQTGADSTPMFMHRTNAEFSVRENSQIRTEFMLPPLSPSVAKAKLWQAPSEGWAVCLQDSAPQEALPSVSAVEAAASRTLRELSIDISLGLVSGYNDMHRGDDSEVVRSMHVNSQDLIDRRASNSTNSTNSTPTAEPTAAPTSGDPTAAPTAVPTGAPTNAGQPTSAPTSIPTVANTVQTTQTIQFPDINHATFPGSAIKIVVCVSYGITIGVWNTTSDNWETGAFVDATAAAARRAAAVTFTSTLPPNLATAAKAAQANTATMQSSMTNNMAAAKASITRAVNSDPSMFASLGVATLDASTVAAVTAPTVGTVSAPADVTAAPTAAPTDEVISGVGGMTINVITLLAPFFAYLGLQRQH